MTRCKVCGKPVENGIYCSADCERKWNEIKRDLEGDLDENPFASDEKVEELKVEKVESPKSPLTSKSPEPPLTSKSPEPPLTRGLEEESEEDQPLELTTDLMVEEREQTENTEIIDLITAARNNSIQAVLQYLGEGANVNQKSAGGWTAVQEASKEGHLEVIKVLVENGANVNIKNERGWTALHRAANYGHLEVVSFLIEKNADVNSKNIEGMCPAVFALKNKHLEVVKLLVEKGTDPNCVIDLRGRTMLFAALRNNWIELAEILIRNGASPNITEGDEAALVFALKNCQMNISKLLVEYGADPKIKDKNGNSVLNIAIRNNFRDVALLLVEKGADVKAHDDRKNTALHLAAAANDLELVKSIVKKKANLVAVNKDGHYPLHKTDNKEIISFLKRKMFPDKIMYSFRIFGLILLLTSIALPFFVSFVFSGITFIAALIFTDWPSKESYRVYLLEILAIYLVLTSAMGVHPNSFDYPFIFLVIPVGVFFIFNFLLRPAALFATAINKDGTKPPFISFYKEHIGNQLSFSPITILRTLNVLALFAIFLMYGFFNYDHLKKNDEYILSHAVKLIPESKRSEYVSQRKVIDRNAPDIASVHDFTIKKIEKEKYVSVDAKKELELAVMQFLSKDFEGALINIEKASQDSSTEAKAKEMKFNLIRFMKIWERIQRPNQSAGHILALANHLLKADQAISGGQMKEEINKFTKGLQVQKRTPPPAEENQEVKSE